MKKIEAIVKPYGLEPLREHLEEFGHLGMTVSEIKNYRTAGKTGPALVAGSSTESPAAPPFTPRLKIEVVVPNEDVPSVVAIFENNAGTNSPQKPITVQSLEDVIRIRTAEHGPGAI